MPATSVPGSPFGTKKHLIPRTPPAEPTLQTRFLVGCRFRSIFLPSVARECGEAKRYVAFMYLRKTQLIIEAKAVTCQHNELVCWAAGKAVEKGFRRIIRSSLEASKRRQSYPLPILPIGGFSAFTGRHCG